MRFGKSWCCLFTGATAGVGLATWATISAGAYCKNKSQEYLDDKLSGAFFVRSLNLTAAIGSGPALPIQMKNMTGLMEDAVSESFLNDLMTIPGWAQYLCTGAVMLPSFFILLTAVLVGTMVVYSREKNEDIIELINHPDSNTGSLADTNEDLLLDDTGEDNTTEYHALETGLSNTINPLKFKR
jgi:hypothetical protein